MTLIENKGKEKLSEQYIRSLPRLSDDARVKICGGIVGLLLLPRFLGQEMTRDH